MTKPKGFFSQLSALQSSQRQNKFSIPGSYLPRPLEATQLTDTLAERRAGF